MVKTMKSEFLLSDLWVSSHSKPNVFIVSSWQKGDSATPMLIVRLILAAGSFGIFVWSLVNGASPYWLIYLTNWGLLLVTLTMFAALLVSVMAKRSKFSSGLLSFVENSLYIIISS